jgi:ADP-heptose:LPS heptosyltransferase
VSLQRGASGLPDPLGGSMDVVATARLVAGLRRVVTVDTMVAHLAGALGRPVHLLLKAEADWRWGREPRTPWYGSVTMHRQTRAGDWSAALDSLSAALRAEG